MLSCSPLFLHLLFFILYVKIHLLLTLFIFLLFFLSHFLTSSPLLSFYTHFSSSYSKFTVTCLFFSCWFPSFILFLLLIFSSSFFVFYFLSSPFSIFFFFFLFHVDCVCNYPGITSDEHVCFSWNEICQNFYMRGPHFFFYTCGRSCIRFFLYHIYITFRSILLCSCLYQLALLVIRNDIIDLTYEATCRLWLKLWIAQHFKAMLYHKAELYYCLLIIRPLIATRKSSRGMGFEHGSPDTKMSIIIRTLYRNNSRHNIVNKLQRAK